MVAELPQRNFIYGSKDQPSIRSTRFLVDKGHTRNFIVLYNTLGIYFLNHFEGPLFVWFSNTKYFASQPFLIQSMSKIRTRSDFGARKCVPFSNSSDFGQKFTFKIRTIIAQTKCFSSVKALNFLSQNFSSKCSKASEPNVLSHLSYFWAKPNIGTSKRPKSERFEPNF